jgi:hypothetical protein
LRYPREFFAIQLEFARKMTERVQGSYLDTILHKTAFYRIRGLDWSLDASHPVWQAYCEGLQGEKEDVEWTYQFYLSHLTEIPEYDTGMQHWGCFFPYQNLLTQAPIEAFYNLYGIKV